VWNHKTNHMQREDNQKGRARAEDGVGETQATSCEKKGAKYIKEKYGKGKKGTLQVYNCHWFAAWVQWGKKGSKLGDSSSLEASLSGKSDPASEGWGKEARLPEPMGGAQEGLRGEKGSDNFSWGKIRKGAPKKKFMQNVKGNKNRQKWNTGIHIQTRGVY